MTTPITFQRVVGVCQFNKGRSACSYLAVNPKESWCCLKGSEMEETIRKRREAGTMGALGDNCPGPPFQPGEE